MRRTTGMRIMIFLAWAAVMVLPAIPTLPTTHAAGCDTCLGPMTKDGLPWWAPTDSFKRGGMPFTKGKLPEIVMLGAQGDGTADRMIWPMFKALDQFGTWTHLLPATPFCPNNICEDPTFDLTHARFHSRYVAFSYGSIATHADASLIGALTPKQRQFFAKYVRAPGYHSNTGYFVWATEGSGGQSPDRLPGISIGPYLSLGTKLLIPGDFETTVKAANPEGIANSGLPFVTIQQALAQSDRTHHADLIHDVNAEANLFTAVICKADGNQPRNACDRGIVKGIAKHLK